MIDNDNGCILYGFGPNNHNQIDIDSNSDCVLKPYKIEFEFKCNIIDIKCGCYHTLFLLNNGNVYGCGQNKRGELLGNNTNTNIIRLKEFNNIKQIYCGTGSSYCIDNINSNKWWMFTFIIFK